MQGFESCSSFCMLCYKHRARTRGGWKKAERGRKKEEQKRGGRQRNPRPRGGLAVLQLDLLFCQESIPILQMLVAQHALSSGCFYVRQVANSSWGRSICMIFLIALWSSGRLSRLSKIRTEYLISAGANPGTHMLEAPSDFLFPFLLK